jgi:hypothetical protein
MVRGCAKNPVRGLAALVVLEEQGCLRLFWTVPRRGGRDGLSRPLEARLFVFLSVGIILRDEIFFAFISISNCHDDAMMKSPQQASS